MILLKIPLFYVKDKQAFRTREGSLRLLGKPIDIAKRLKNDGFRLIHIVDLDALKGLSTNLDIYDSLTYFINVQVECAPVDALVKKLLLFRCRVVIPPSGLDLSKIREKNLLVARVSKDNPVEDFHDVLIENSDDKLVKKFKQKGKRVIIFEKDRGKEPVWGMIISAF